MSQLWNFPPCSIQMLGHLRQCSNFNIVSYSWVKVWVSVNQIDSSAKALCRAGSLGITGKPDLLTTDDLRLIKTSAFFLKIN
ncbi:LOW QUALITY PROTEIN: hypothetical protein PSENEW3_00004106 [Picochlorum sp. SENEW3]|nr:LOW QUALITY PROTEIN: hypothetical protein PSENEW3_00004106 [Picochlorum sp. SENEW3]